MAANSKCCDDGGRRVDGVHNTRIYRFQVVTEAEAHNQEIEQAMTEIAIPQHAVAVPDQQPNFSTDLVFWAQQAEAAAIYAERVCSTQMVPAAYRGKPAEAAAAILAGTELGFSPIRSLNAFDNIQGTPAPKAMTLRALVLAQGHQVETVEQTATRGVVRGRRRGQTDWQTSTWDIARAKLLPQFKTNANYANNPGAMLVARATAEVCRWIGSDAIMGVPYASEEDERFAPIEAAPATRRLTVAELDAEPATTTENQYEMLTDKQRGHMFALWGELGFAGDENREQRLGITAKILGLPELESSSDLTRADADRVIAALIERKERTAQAEEMPV
jgi:hypothetical protein